MLVWDTLIRISISGTSFGGLTYIPREHFFGEISLLDDTDFPTIVLGLQTATLL